MCSELLQKVVEHHNTGRPFVLYRQPGSHEVKAVLQQGSEVNYVNDFSETGFLFAPYHAERETILLRPDTVLTAQNEPLGHTALKGTKGFDPSQGDKKRHLALVAKGIAEIRQTGLKKVVLSRALRVAGAENPFDLFKVLIGSYDKALCYLWHHPKVGTWLGATPEILVKVENQRFTTMALAGTLKNSDGQPPEWGQKERDEQQMVTDYIANALQPTVTNLNIGERESIRAGDLWHLRTKLQGRLKKEDLGHIIRALHPTPAICGLPTRQAQHFIESNEGYDRHFYTGYIGELNFQVTKSRSTNSRNHENKAYRAVVNTTKLFVNLRCMQLTDTAAILYVGGGVTRASEPEKEWLETVEKSKTMLRVLGVQ